MFVFFNHIIFLILKEKGTPWEGAIRTVSFLWSPLIRDKPRVFHDLMHITDWLPTLYSAAGKRCFIIKKMILYCVKSVLFLSEKAVYWFTTV